MTKKDEKDTTAAQPPAADTADQTPPTEDAEQPRADLPATADQQSQREVELTPQVESAIAERQAAFADAEREAFEEIAQRELAAEQAQGDARSIGEHVDEFRAHLAVIVELATIPAGTYQRPEDAARSQKLSEHAQALQTMLAE